MSTEERKLEDVFYRVVVIQKDGTRAVHARNVSLATAETMRIAVSHLGKAVIERQRKLDRTNAH